MPWAAFFGAMRENDLFRNTWIIFTSDHGEMLGDHHMSQKNLFFEGSAHVPLLIVPPSGSGIPHNLTVDSLTEIADIYPTILELAGVTPPEGITGRSLLAPEKLPKDRVFYGDSLHTNFCVMKDRIKLVYTTCGDHTLLFDLNSDPMERNDLSTDPAWQEKKNELWRLLLKHTAETAPEALEKNKDNDCCDPSALRFHTTRPPRFPGDMPGRWFGFHYHDYSVDTFH